MLRHQLRQVSPGGALYRGKDQIVMLDGSGMSSCTQLRATLTNLCTSMLSTLLSNRQLASSSCNTNGTIPSCPPLLSFSALATPPSATTTTSLPCLGRRHSCRYQMGLVVVGVKGNGGRRYGTRWDRGGGGGSRGGLRSGRGPGEWMICSEMRWRKDMTGTSRESAMACSWAKRSCLRVSLQEPLLHPLLPLHHLLHQLLKETLHLLPRQR